MESANLSQCTGWAGRTQLGWEGWWGSGHHQWGFLSIIVKLSFNYYLIIVQLLLRRMMGRRPSSDWSSVRVPHLSTIGAIRKERYMIMSCKFFFFFWKWSIHNSFGHIFSILFSLFVDKLNIFSTSEIPFIVGTRLSLDTTVGLHLCVRTYSPTRTSERV